VGDEGVERLHSACLAAVERCAVKELDGIAPDTFAELGEALFWLIALAEARGRHKKTALLRGLGWARDRIAHGVLLTAPQEWHYGTELGKWVLGKGKLGTRSEYRWLSPNEVDPKRTQKGDQTVGETAYDDHLAGRAVIEVLREGVAEAMATR